MSSLVAQIRDDLSKAGLDQHAVNTATKIMEERLPPKTYTAAVWFLGIITIILAGGAIASVVLKTGGAEGLWGAVGAGVGALAGIFGTKTG